MIIQQDSRYMLPNNGCKITCVDKLKFTLLFGRISRLAKMCKGFFCSFNLNFLFFFFLLSCIIIIIIIIILFRFRDSNLFLCFQMTKRLSLFFSLSVCVRLLKNKNAVGHLNFNNGGWRQKRK